LIRQDQADHGERTGSRPPPPSSRSCAGCVGRTPNCAGPTTATWCH